MRYPIPRQGAKGKARRTGLSHSLDLPINECHLEDVTMARKKKKKK